MVRETCPELVSLSFPEDWLIQIKSRTLTSASTTPSISNSHSAARKMDSVPNQPPTSDEQACLTVLNVIRCGTLQKALKATMELDLFEILSKAGPNTYLSPADIVQQIPTNNPQAPMMVDRILRFLASYSLVDCSTIDGSRRYGAAPATKFLTRNTDDGSLMALALLSFNMDYLHYLKEAVIDGGIAFDKASGMTGYEYNRTDPEFSKLYNEAMGGHSTIIMKGILDRYDGFNDVNVLVDVGGGTGASLHSILRKHPHIKGIVYDLPHVISEAPAFSGVKYVGGDMFDSVPSGDAIFMKGILHNWNDELCVKVLKNCLKALPDNGKVIVLESIIPEAPETTVVAQNTFNFDIIMLARFGGKVRTEKEFEWLAKEAGFSGFKALIIYANVWVIEFSQ